MKDEKDQTVTHPIGTLVGLEAETVFKVVKKRQPPFYYVMLITGGVTLLQERVKSVAAHSLFMAVIEKMLPTSQNKVPVHFSSLAEHFGVTVNAIYRQFRYLVDADIVRKVRKGVYLVNPHIVWVGDSSKRYHALIKWDTGEVE